VIENVLDNERPGLVVFGGDQITGQNAFLENATAYIDQIVDPLVRRGLSWASIYGNHDSDFNLSREGILAREQRWPNARTTKMAGGDDGGVSNYYLLVHGPSGLPELILWFFDSRGGFLFQRKNSDGGRIGQPNWVDSEVAEWQQQTNARLRQRWQRVIPSLAFVHIPTNASYAAQLMGRVRRHQEPGINDDYPLAQQAQGWCPDGRDNGEHCQYGGQDLPFMHAMANTAGLMALFSAHDHGNSWCWRWSGLLPGMTVAGNTSLCFGQHSGYGGYGSWVRGARQVRVTLDGLKNLELDTWIRLETGDVVGNVTLNSTYGEDYYPATPNTKTKCPKCDLAVPLASQEYQDPL
jgi:hypothetical protein